MSTTSWEAIENALRAWVVSSSGLAEGRVIWAYQDGRRPEDTMITLAIGSDIPVDQDEVRDNYDASRPAGQEIALVVGGMREFALTVEAFTSAVVGDGGARALLQRVRAAVYKPSVRASFSKLTLSAFDVGGVQIGPKIFPSTFEGRARLTPRFYVREVVEEYVGYIAKVQLRDRTVSPPFEFEVDST